MDEFDQRRAEAFANGMVETLNAAARALMISLGHRTGLFDMLSANPDVTSEQLAKAAGLQERYVREWLAAMTLCCIVEYDEHRRTFRIPAEHAASLTRAARPNNLAAFMQYVPVLASVEDEIVDRFRNGGGVPYSSFPRFHEVMAEESEQTVLSALFSDILPLVDGIEERLERGARAADLGCGRGHALLKMAERFPRSEFVGMDLSAEAIEHARTEARHLGLKNIQFVEMDLSNLDETGEPERFDFVTTFDAVHDQRAPEALLRGIHKSLRPGGVYLMQDIHASSELHENLMHPLGPFLYTISCLHCMTVSLAQGGEGLGTMWGVDTAQRMLEQAGFRQVEVHTLPHDAQNAYLIARA